MIFDKAIEKVKQLIAADDKYKQMQMYEEELHNSTNDVSELRISINNKVAPRLCVFITPGADIDRVQELYDKVGIKLKKHLLIQGHRRQNILYINSADFAKLDAKRQLFFKRTTSNHKIYKQNLTYTVKRERN